MQLLINNFNTFLHFRSLIDVIINVFEQKLPGGSVLMSNYNKFYFK